MHFGDARVSDCGYADVKGALEKCPKKGRFTDLKQIAKCCVTQQNRIETQKRIETNFFKPIRVREFFHENNGNNRRDSKRNNTLKYV